VFPSRERHEPEGDHEAGPVAEHAVDVALLKEIREIERAAEVERHAPRLAVIHGQDRIRAGPGSQSNGWPNLFVGKVVE